ncbi:MAG TPA: chorismate synthase [Firmicutes bacterium]|nr:chorismate synthase [Bacillota bacterium]
MLRYLTAGESHGQALLVILEGLPAGLPLVPADIDRHLARRQAGWGRGGRMKIERDGVVILSGVRHGFTIGSPIALEIANRDWARWQEIMRVDPPAAPLPQETEGAMKPPDAGGGPAVVTRPRPGHADLAGALKYGHEDMRQVLERASARETAARVAAGAVAMRFLAFFGITVGSHVVGIGEVTAPSPAEAPLEAAALADLLARAEASPVRCADPEAAAAMIAAIDRAKAEGDTLGGVFEVIVHGVPPGLGSHVQWDRKLDGRLARALMSIQAIKGVEIGCGFAAAGKPGSAVHDPIYYDQEKRRTAWGFYRRTNRAGGLEGGMSNGEAIVLRAAMKPIATLMKPLPSVDIKSKESFLAAVERSDTCAVPAAAVVGEAVVALEIAAAFLEKFGGDSMTETANNYQSYLKMLAGR